MPMKYFPVVTCAKDNAVIDPTHVRRVHDTQNNRRYLIAECHGKKVEVDFADTPGAPVTVFNEQVG